VHRPGHQPVEPLGLLDRRRALCRRAVRVAAAGQVEDGHRAAVLAAARGGEPAVLQARGGEGDAQAERVVGEHEEAHEEGEEPDRRDGHEARGEEGGGRGDRGEQHGERGVGADGRRDVRHGRVGRQVDHGLVPLVDDDEEVVDADAHDDEDAEEVEEGEEGEAAHGLV